MLSTNTKDKQLEIANKLNITLKNLSVKRSIYRKKFPKLTKYYKGKIHKQRFHKNLLLKRHNNKKAIQNM